MDHEELGSEPTIARVARKSVGRQCEREVFALMTTRGDDNRIPNKFRIEFPSNCIDEN